MDKPHTHKHTIAHRSLTTRGVSFVWSLQHTIFIGSSSEYPGTLAAAGAVDLPLTPSFHVHCECCGAHHVKALCSRLSVSPMVGILDTIATETRGGMFQAKLDSDGAVTIFNRAAGEFGY